MLMVFAITSLAEVPVMEIIKGHSATIFIEEDIGTVALGNPGIAETIILKPNTLLINAKSPGATSLTLFGKSGRLYDYRILVSHDLTLLSRHLQKLDTRIRVETDPNGDAVILSGIAETKEIIERAVEAAIRFFGDASITMSNALNARAMNDPNNTLTNTQQNRRGGNAGNPAATSTGNEQLATGQTRVINLLTTAESMLPAPKRMEGLLKQVDPRISVELSNSVFILKGNVKTPADLARALSIADRFVSQDERPNIQVISDAGGVLAGEIQAERDNGIEPVDPNLALQTIGGARGGAGARGGRVGNALRQPLAEGKGNLAQNLSRGDVITAAAGRVMSLIQVDDQPRVEIQMRIVAVDRNKTDAMGIDWRLDGTKINVSSPLGKIVNIYPGQDANGNSNPFTITDKATSVLHLFPGSFAIHAFLETIESRGAGITLSEPLLTAVSGESTSFLVGGSIPIPSQTTSTGGASSATQTTTNAQFLQYGLKLIARPTLLENGKISIVLDQSITEPDYDKQIQMLGANIPGFSQKTVSTVTEAEDGETWAVAGLITEDMSENLRQIPFFSNIPVLGALFRSTTDKKTRSELIITVTARRVGARASGKGLSAGNPKEALMPPVSPTPATTEKLTGQVWQ